MSEDSWHRYYDGESLRQSLEKAVDEMKNNTSVKQHLKKWTLPLALSSGLLGLAFYGGLTYEPQKLEMPRPLIQGQLYKPSDKDNEEEAISFDSEPLKEDISLEYGGLLSAGVNQNSKLSTDNRIVAYLVKTHAQTQHDRGLLKSNPYTDNQFNTYAAYISPDERRFSRNGGGSVFPIWAKSIEVALTQSKSKDGKVDLEDVMAVSGTLTG